MPESVKGYTQWPLEGVSMRYTFDDAHAATRKDFQYYSMLGSRGIWKVGWKASTTHPTLSNWGHFEQDRWELYNTDADRSEARDLAAEHPEKLEELKALWFAAAGRFLGLPIDDRGWSSCSPRLDPIWRGRCIGRPTSQVRIPYRSSCPQYTQPLIQASVRWWTSRRQGRKASCSTKVLASEDMSVHQGGTSELFLQLRRDGDDHDHLR